MAQPTVVLFPEPGAWGPTNNLVALGNHLRERGIRTAFVIEESFEGELATRGFEERLMRMAPPPEGEEAVGQASKCGVEATAGLTWTRARRGSDREGRPRGLNTLPVNPIR